MVREWESPHGESWAADRAAEHRLAPDEGISNVTEWTVVNNMYADGSQGESGSTVRLLKTPATTLALKGKEGFEAATHGWTRGVVGKRGGWRARPRPQRTEALCASDSGQIVDAV